MFNIVVTSSAAERTGWLSEVAATIDRFFPKGSNQQGIPGISVA